MTSKSRVLSALLQAAGEAVSGQALAARLGISRAAVWKAVAALREDGYAIEAMPNRGYRLAAAEDILTSESVAALLPPESPWRVRVYPQLASTNRTLKQMASEGEKSGAVILAETQSQGRGRMGRDFFSPPGSGLYMSFLLRPATLLTGDAVLLTTAVSVAVARAIAASCGVQVGIKWVNDLYLGDRKVCGILTEAASDLESGGIDSVVIGIGVNFCARQEQFPPELRETARALFETPPAGVTRSRLAAAILREAEGLEEACRTRAFLEEYRARSILLGKPVRCTSARETFEAMAVDIDAQGGLVVRRADGTQCALHTGEVTVRRMD